MKALGHIARTGEGSSGDILQFSGQFDTAVKEYCRVPERRGPQKTASPPSCDETRSVNPLVHEQVDGTNTGPILTKAG